MNTPAQCALCGGDARYGEVRTSGPRVEILCADCAMRCEHAEESAREAALWLFLGGATAARLVREGTEGKR